MNLLAVSHWKQRRQADCLVACTAMVLDYLQVPVRYERLLQVLRTMPIGTLFRNLHHLESAYGLSVTIDYGSPEQLQAYLDTGLPVIVSLNTQMLSYWDYQEMIHAVVVIGIEGETIYLNDPAFPEAPQVIALAEFNLAWYEEKNLYGVIGLAPP